MAVAWLEPIILRCGRVTLEPLTHQHCDDLIEAVKDGQLWRLWYTLVPKPEPMHAELDRRLGLQAAGSMLPFAAIDNTTGKAVGMTTYMNIEAAHRRVEIGSTWYRKGVQRTTFNTQCKQLLLDPRLRAAGLHCGGIPHALFLITRAAAASSDSAPSSTAFCAAISWPATARCATPASTASSPPSGRR
jgi:Acetyltransferase (GNAT) domain